MYFNNKDLFIFLYVYLFIYFFCNKTILRSSKQMILPIASFKEIIKILKLFFILFDMGTNQYANLQVLRYFRIQKLELLTSGATFLLINSCNSFIAS